MNRREFLKDLTIIGALAVLPVIGPRHTSYRIPVLGKALVTIEVFKESIPTYFFISTNKIDIEYDTSYIPTYSTFNSVGWKTQYKEITRTTIKIDTEMEGWAKAVRKFKFGHIKIDGVKYSNMFIRGEGTIVEAYKL